MKTFSPNQLWRALKKHQHDSRKLSLRKLFAKDSKRVTRFSVQAAGLQIDYSKNLLTAKTLALLQAFAESRQLPAKIQALFAGEIVNQSEKQAALHPALRATNKSAQLKIMQTQMQTLAEKIIVGEWRGFDNQVITDVVNLGVGGSELGPALACQALAAYRTSKMRCHFVANIDSTQIQTLLQQLNPATTLFLMTSKNFSTAETFQNAELAKKWLRQAAPGKNILQKHFIAITTQVDRAKAWGIPAENILSLLPEVGGRFSVWSAVGLPIALQIGWGNFQKFLAGAEAMDRHFQTAPLSQNAPVILALLSLWYSNFYQAQTQAILPYAQCLQLLPLYLQQLHMESLGKSVQQNGKPVTHTTGPIIWGSVETQAQHTFHQLLHQGSLLIPIDFIAVREAGDALYANCLAQQQALLQGRTQKQIITALMQQGFSRAEANRLAPHQILPGNRPSTHIEISALTPQAFGALLALYEHKVYVQSVLWNIDCFDQWGVEWGKDLARQQLARLE